MILAIDLGNTNIVLGCIEDGEILSIVRLQTNAGATDIEYAIKLKQVMEYCKMDPMAFEGAIISSVVPPVTSALQKAVQSLTGKEPLTVGPGTRTDMRVLLDDPSTLAGDLIVGSVAAIACYGAPLIVIDMGTATTMVVIDSENSYRGGAIFPGVRLSFKALSAGASLLPEISIVPPQRAVSTNTVDSMRCGAVYGTAAMLDGMIERMEAELGQRCTVVATGGLASSVTPYCRREIICDDDLLLKGLWILYQKNT